MPAEPPAVEDGRNAGRQGQLTYFETSPAGARSPGPHRDLVRLGRPDGGIVEGVPVGVQQDAGTAGHPHQDAGRVPGQALHRSCLAVDPEIGDLAGPLPMAGLEDDVATAAQPQVVQ